MIQSRLDEMRQSMPRALMPIRVIGTGLAATAILLTAACGRQTTAATAVSVNQTPVPAVSVNPRSSAPPTPQSSGPPNQEKLDAAAGAIDRLSASYPNSYTGLAVDNPGNRVIVYRKRDPAFDAALARLHTGVRVDLRDAPRSNSELVATRNRVEALMGHTVAYTILSVGNGSVASYTAGVVEVGVTGDLARARRELAARFGDRVAVSATEPAVG
jgi:hypothetical protein